jgi:hypothetical protein
MSDEQLLHAGVYGVSDRDFPQLGWFECFVIPHPEFS